MNSSVTAARDLLMFWAKRTDMDLLRFRKLCNQLLPGRLSTNFVTRDWLLSISCTQEINCDFVIGNPRLEKSIIHFTMSSSSSFDKTVGGPFKTKFTFRFRWITDLGTLYFFWAQRSEHFRLRTSDSALTRFSWLYFAFRLWKKKPKNQLYVNTQCEWCQIWLILKIENEFIQNLRSMLACPPCPLTNAQNELRKGQFQPIVENWINRNYSKEYDNLMNNNSFYGYHFNNAAQNHLLVSFNWFWSTTFSQIFVKQTRAFILSVFNNITTDNTWKISVDIVQYILYAKNKYFDEFYSQFSCQKTKENGQSKTTQTVDCPLSSVNATLLCIR